MPARKRALKYREKLNHFHHVMLVKVKVKQPESFSFSQCFHVPEKEMFFIYPKNLTSNAAWENRLRPTMISKSSLWEKIFGFSIFQLMIMDCGNFVFRSIISKIYAKTFFFLCSMTIHFQ